jgi:HSP20 family protein
MKGQEFMNTQYQDQTTCPECAQTERRFVAPEVNIIENEAQFVLEADMPGVNKEGLEVTLEGNELTLTGHRQEGQVKGNLVHRESRAADFRRIFELAPDIDATRIAAQIDSGVLTVTLPKAEKVKPRRIAVN